MNFNKTRILALSFACLWFATTTAIAEQVTLQSQDGSVSMNGELISFDGKEYILRSTLGEITVRVEEVNCIGEFCPAITAVDFAVMGADTVGARLMPQLFDAFANSQTLTLELTDGQQYVFHDTTGEVFADITMKVAPAKAAFRALLDDRTEVTMSTRPITLLETQAMIEAGQGDPNAEANQVVLALDALVVLVAEGNLVGSLGVTELARIFSGEITNWNEVGGVNHVINVYRTGDDSDAATDFAALVMDASGRSFGAKTQQMDEDVLMAAVAGDEFGIGFGRYGETAGVRMVPLRGACGFLSVPDDFTIKSGEYLLARRIMLYASNGASANPGRIEKIAALLDFARSDDAQGIVRDTGFVDLSVTSLPMAVQGLRMVNTVLGDQSDATFRQVQAMVSALASGERLSTTLRFKAGAGELEAMATSSINRLAEYLRGVDLTGKEVLVAGFTDSAGTATQNEGQSLRVARQVAQSLQEALGADADNIRITPAGFGEVSPLVCNSSLEGRTINRRVEIWVRDLN